MAQAPSTHRPGDGLPPLCPPCRRDLEGDVWTLCGQVRGALLAVSRGGDTGLVLHHFDDALDGLGRLSGYQERGSLDAPPDVAALRRRLSEERYSVVSGALAARTSPFRCVPPPSEARVWSQYASHAPVIEEILGQLAALEVVVARAAQESQLAAPDTMSQDSLEQRAEPRDPVRFPVRISPGELGGTATDLSRGGAGVRLSQVLEVGSRVWVTFCHRCQLEAEGVVRWAAADGDRCAAGVQFRLGLSGAVADQLLGDRAAA